MPIAWQRASSRASGSLCTEAAAEPARSLAPICVVMEMNGRCDDRRRHGHETHDAAYGAYIERGPTHQWNICTVWGW